MVSDRMAPCFLAVASAFYLMAMPKRTSECRPKQVCFWPREGLGAGTGPLLDLLRKAPWLLQLLTPDDQKALSATSRSFREYFIAQVKVITVSSDEEVALAIKKQWPAFTMVIHNSHFAFVYDFYRGLPERVLAVVKVLTLCDRKEATIFMLRPKHSPASDAALAKQAAKQLLQQLSARRPQLRHFTLIKVELPVVSLAILATLNTSEWPLLTDLNLSDSDLGAQGVKFLVRTRYPMLQRLNLSWNRLDAKATALLAQGNWPYLRELQLSFNYSLDGKAMANLAAAQWPLPRLILSGVPITDTMANGLAQLQLSHLTSLFLDQTSLTAAAMSQLASADLPVLRHLTLSHNWLGTEAMSHMKTIHMPELKRLDLTRARVDAKGACWLVQSALPLLSDLQLSRNRLDATGVRHLAQGDWPNLRHMSLHRNPFYQSGGKELVKGNWPELSSLRLSLWMLNRDSAMMVGLEPNTVLELKFTAASKYVHNEYLCRNVAQISSSCWPTLENIQVA